MNQRVGVFLGALAFTLSSMLFASPSEHKTEYDVIKLVANSSSENAHNVDGRLLNPWGLTFSNDGDLIVADNGNDGFLATSYEENGDTRAFNIVNGDAPTGLETNDSPRDFIFTSFGVTGPARLLFASANGDILAFSKHVNTTMAIPVISRGGSPHFSVYTGLALGTVFHGAMENEGHKHQYIFAADFHNGNIDVFDSYFNYVKSFTDPSLPEGYAPFNVQNINGLLYVTFALNDANAPVAGAGFGFVDVFKTDGTYVKRLIPFTSGTGPLNAPWGLVQAPHDFGTFSDALLVGNNGDGKINAFDIKDGTFLGTLSDDDGDPIVIDGLWSIKFGPCEPNPDMNSHRGPKLFFTSGPSSEAGLVGVIVKHRHH